MDSCIIQVLLTRDECRFKCLVQNCSCMTHIAHTASYRDGSCYLLKPRTPYFLQHLPPLGVENGTTPFTLTPNP